MDGIYTALTANRELLCRKHNICNIWREHRTAHGEQNIAYTGNTSFTHTGNTTHRATYSIHLDLCIHRGMSQTSVRSTNISLLQSLKPMHWHTAQLHKSPHRYENTMCVCGGRAVLKPALERDLISPKTSHFSSCPPSHPPTLRRSSLSVCTSIPAPLAQSWTSQRGVRSCSPASPCSQRSIWTRLIPATMWRPAAHQM